MRKSKKNIAEEFSLHFETRGGAMESVLRKLGIESEAFVRCTQNLLTRYSKFVRTSRWILLKFRQKLGNTGHLETVQNLTVRFYFLLSKCNAESSPIY